MNDESVPSIPSGETNESAGSPAPVQQNPFPPTSAGATDDPWYTYAQQMFPGAEITPDIIAGLKSNMMQMIGTTISEINARHAIANEYNQKVAQGEE